MITEKGFDEKFMLSLFKKEATYDAGVAMAANSCSMPSFELEVDEDDKVEDNRDTVTGTEQATEQELIEKAFKASYKEPRVKPNSLIGIAALVLGNHVTTQDGVLTAYKHKITPLAVGSELPSIAGVHKKGGVQTAYKGIKGSSIKLSGEQGGLLAMEAELMGSGSRDRTNVEAFTAKVVESWMKISNCSVFLESGADISVAATLTQGAQNISGTAPENIGSRMRNFEVGYNNNPEGQPGFGGAGVLQDIDKVRAAIELKFQMLFKDKTEMDYFNDQTDLAIEFDLKGGIVADTGTMYYGAQIIIPKFRLKKNPKQSGGPNDTLVADYECTVLDDGTNAPIIIEGYNAVPAYLAA